MRNEDGAKAGAKIVDYTTIIPPLHTRLFFASGNGRVVTLFFRQRKWPSSYDW